jgi:hypothetical protein
MLTAIQIVYVFIALQFESNSTGSALNLTDESPSDPWSFVFSLAAAVGSGATALALYFIWKQSRLAEERMRLTKEELEVTLPRPWLGTIKIAPTPDKKEVMILLKNFGRYPGRVTGLIGKDSNTRLSRNDVAGGHVNQTEITLFPDHEIWHVVPLHGEALRFVGLILEYAYGKGDKRGKYGVICEYSPTSKWFATIDEWFE